MRNSKRKIIIGGIVAVLGIALLAYVAHVLTARLIPSPATFQRLNLSFSSARTRSLQTQRRTERLRSTSASRSSTLPQLVTVTNVYTLKKRRKRGAEPPRVLPRKLPDIRR